MKTFVKANTWLTSIIEKGWGNGYVIIPKGHPMHGVHYDEINVEVHGGLTFSSFTSKITKWPEITAEDIKQDGWVVGFDTAHCDDSPSNWPRANVLKETESLKNQLIKITH